MKWRLTNSRHGILPPAIDRFIFVGSRLPVSDGRPFRDSARWVNPATGNKPFDFENVAFPPHDRSVLVVEVHFTPS